MSSLSPVLFRAISLGMRAPNPHNTQAWKVRILDTHSFLLYVDENRLLMASDPLTRQIHLGQGAFIEMLTAGMTGEGYETLVDYFPEGVYGIEECGKKPVARITVLKNSGIPRDPLCDAIPDRITNRSAYTGSLIGEAEWDELRRRTGPTHSVISTVGNDTAVREYIRIAREAGRIDISFDAAYEETWQWLRKNDREVAEQKDGLSIRSQGFFSGVFGGVMLKFAEAGIASHEKYLSERTRKQTIELFGKNIGTARGFLYQVTATNTPIDWVLTGMDYARINLAATTMGLAIHPLNQVLQEYPAMDALRREFEVLAGQQAGEKVQMLVRVGRAGPGFRSPRRPVESILMEEE